MSANDWQEFMNPAANEDHTLTFTLEPDRFPFRFREHTITINKIDLLVVTEPKVEQTTPATVS